MAKAPKVTENETGYVVRIDGQDIGVHSDQAKNEAEAIKVAEQAIADLKNDERQHP